MNIEINNETCRHEYVKIYQRKYKDFGRRLVSTRGYLPTGFSNKDFSFLTIGAYCFCTKCRARLFPPRRNVAKTQNTNLPDQLISTPLNETTDTIWTPEVSEAESITSQEIEVEELQLEPTEVSDIVEKEIAANQQSGIVPEDGEE